MSTIKQRYCVIKIHQNVYVEACTTSLPALRFKLNYSLGLVSFVATVFVLSTTSCTQQQLHQPVRSTVEVSEKLSVHTT